MTHYLTETLSRSTDGFGRLILTFRPNITDGDYCVATVTDTNIADLYNDLRSDYPESETPKEDLQAIITYCVANGRFYNEDGDEIDEYAFSINNDY